MKMEQKIPITDAICFICLLSIDFMEFMCASMEWHLYNL